LGTLTTLTVDDVVIDGKVITITGDTDDTFTITTGAHGATTLATDDNADMAGDLTFDVDGDIILDADGGDVYFKDDGTTIAHIQSGRFFFDKGNTGLIGVDEADADDPGRDMTLQAGNAPAGGTDLNGGDLILKAGAGDGSGTSAMTFSTKVSGTDAVAERMRIHTDGNVGIGVADPDQVLEVNGGVHIEETAYFTTPATATGDGSTGINWRNGNKYHFIFAASTDETITFTHNPSGACNLILKLKQPSSGAGCTVDWEVTSGTIFWAGGGTEDVSEPTLSTSVNAVDILSFYFDGTNYYGVSSLGFSA